MTTRHYATQIATGLLLLIAILFSGGMCHAQFDISDLDPTNPDSPLNPGNVDPSNLDPTNPSSPFNPSNIDPTNPNSIFNPSNLDPTNPASVIHSSNIGNVPWKEISKSAEAAAKAPWRAISIKAPGGISWKDLDPRNIPWQDLDPTNIPWQDLPPSQIPWDKLDPRKIPWEKLDPSQIPWERIDPSNVPWEKIDPTQVPWETLQPKIISDSLGKLSRVNLRDLLENNLLPADLVTVITKIESVGWEQFLPDTIPWDWNQFDVTKIKWERLDPSKVPWERADPSQIDWSSADPSKPLLEATEKLEGTPLIGNAIQQMNELGNSLSVSVPNIGEKLAQGEKAIRNRAADFEESVRTEVGNAVQEIKEQPWYQEFTSWLSQFTEIIVIDFKTRAEFEYCFESGVYYLNAEVSPGFNVTEATIEQNTIPDIDPLVAAASSVKTTLVTYSQSNNYDAVRAELEEKYGSTNVRVVSKRFANWMSATNLGTRAVVAVFTDGGEAVFQRTVRIAEMEIDEVWAWINRRAGDTTAADRIVTPEFIKSMLLGKSPSTLVPEIQIEKMTIRHENKFEAIGPVKEAINIINALIGKVGQFPPVPDQFRVVHDIPGYVIVWKLSSAPPAIEDWVEALVPPVSVDVEFGAKNDRLLKAVKSFTGDSFLEKTLTDALTVYLEINQNPSQMISEQLQKEVLSKVGIDELTIRKRLQHDEKSVVVNLKETEVADEIVKRLAEIAIGNEGSASVDRLEVDLGTQTLSVAVTIRHRHVWNVDGLLGNLTGSLGLDYSRSTGGQPLPPDVRNTAGNERSDRITSRTQPTPTGLDSPIGRLRWHFLENGGVEKIGSPEFASEQPVVFIPGALTKQTEARSFATDLSARLRRPVLYVLNESIVDGDSGTAGYPTDLAEFVYDASWPTSITKFLSRADIQTLATTGSSINPPANRLQRNPTTRRVAALLETLPGDVDVVTHSHGAACLRNAVISLGILDNESSIGRRVRWIALGSPLLPTEYGFSPVSYVSLWHPSDRVRDYLSASVDADNTPSVSDIISGGSNRSLWLYLPVLNSNMFSPTFRRHVESGFDAGDIDGNGIDEAVSICRINHVVTRVLFNQWLGSRFDYPSMSDLSRPFGVAKGNLFVRDANGDGFDDLVLVNPSRRVSGDVYHDGYVLVRLNDQSGGFDELISTRQFLHTDDAGWDDPESKIVVGRFSGSLDINEHPMLEVGAVRPAERRVLLTPLKMSSGRRNLGDTLSMAIGLRNGTTCFVGSGNVSGSRLDELVISGTYCSWTKKRLFRKSRAIVCRYADVFSVAPNRLNWERACQLSCAPTMRIVFGNWNTDSLDDLARVRLATPHRDRGESCWQPYFNLGQQRCCCTFRCSHGMSRLPDPCSVPIVPAE